MICIMSPSLSMEECEDHYINLTVPQRIDMARRIVDFVNKTSIDEIMTIMGINYKLAEMNKLRYERIKFDNNGSPAILCYTGTAYKNMNPSIFNDQEIEFCREHVRILSGLYGVLNPYDSVYEYRLELKSKISVDGTRDLYEYFGRVMYDDIVRCDRQIVNLCSNEYSKSVKPYITSRDMFITCVFKTNKNGYLRIVANDAKAARGRMVNFIVRNRITRVELLKEFDELNYRFDKTLSNSGEYVFIK